MLYTEQDRIANGQSCRPTWPLAATPSTMEARWPPLLVMQGDAEAVVSPHNGQAAAQGRAAAAGACASAVRSVRRGNRYPMPATDFKRKGSTVATLVAVDGLAPAWSGGAASRPFSDVLGPDASRLAGAFAASQSAPRQTQAQALRMEPAEARPGHLQGSHRAREAVAGRRLEVKVKRHLHSTSTAQGVRLGDKSCAVKEARRDAPGIDKDHWPSLADIERASGVRNSRGTPYSRH